MHINIKRNKMTGNSLGYGFVSLRSYIEAEAARRALHRGEMGGRNAVRVNWAHQNTSLFVSNTHGMDSEGLQLCFGDFGLVIPEETFVRDGCGYVRFADRRAAEEAKLMLDGEAGQVRDGTTATRARVTCRRCCGGRPGGSTACMWSLWSRWTLGASQQAGPSRWSAAYLN